MFRALRHRHFYPVVGTTLATGAFCRYQYQKPNKPLVMMMSDTKTVEPISQTTNSYDAQKFELIMAELPNCKSNGDIHNIIKEIPKSIEITKKDIIYILGFFKKGESGWYIYMDNTYDFLEKRANLTFEDKIEVVERVGLEIYYCGLSQIDLSLNRKEIKNYDEIRNKQKHIFNVVFIDNQKRYTIEEMNKLMHLYSQINNIQESNDVDAHYNIRIKLLRKLI